MENRYTKIDELIQDIELLGNWKEVSERNKFLKILSKITTIYHGYEVTDGEDETTEYYPEEVFEAIVEVCSKKFPTKIQVYDETGKLRDDCPEYSNYLVLATSKNGISLLGERTRIDEIARNEFGIDVYDIPSVEDRADVESLIASCIKYLKEIKTQKGSTISMQLAVSNAIERGTTKKDVDDADRQTLKQELEGEKTND